MNTAEVFESQEAPEHQTLEMLRVQDLHAFYGESHILHGVNFDVKRGELVTLLGRNGAGRSTTLKAIMNMVGRRTGSIMINGEETMTCAPHHIARLGVGYCPEHRGIFSGLNVMENLTLPPVVRSGGMGLEEIFSMFPNLYERRTSPGTKLSGGEQQRVAIAVALANSGRIDEAKPIFQSVFEAGLWLLVRQLYRQNRLPVPGKALSPAAISLLPGSNGRWQAAIQQPTAGGEDTAVELASRQSTHPVRAQSSAGHGPASKKVLLAGPGASAPASSPNPQYPRPIPWGPGSAKVASPPRRRSADPHRRPVGGEPGLPVHARPMSAASWLPAGWPTWIAPLQASSLPVAASGVTRQESSRPVGSHRSMASAGCSPGPI